MKKLERLTLGKRLTKEEQKMIIGGEIKCRRWHPDPQKESGTFSPLSMETGLAWCNVWIAYGYNCSCQEV